MFQHIAYSLTNRQGLFAYVRTCKTLISSFPDNVFYHVWTWLLIYHDCSNNHVQAGQLNHVQAGQLNHVQADQLNHVQAGQLNHVQAGKHNHVQAGQLNHVQAGKPRISNSGEPIVLRHACFS